MFIYVAHKGEGEISVLKYVVSKNNSASHSNKLSVGIHLEALIILSIIFT